MLWLSELFSRGTENSHVLILWFLMCSVCYFGEHFQKFHSIYYTFYSETIILALNLNKAKTYKTFYSKSKQPQLNFIFSFPHPYVRVLVLERIKPQEHMHTLYIQFSRIIGGPATTDKGSKI